MAVPSRPTNLSASQTGTTAVIALSWTDNSSDETGFKVQRKENRAAEWSTINTTAADATSYNDNTVTLGYFYEYRILATNASGDSEASNEVELIPTKVGSFNHVKERLMAMIALASYALTPQNSHVFGNLNLNPTNLLQNMPIVTVRIMPRMVNVVFGNRTPANVAGKMYEVDFILYVYAVKESDTNEWTMTQALADLIMDYLFAQAHAQSAYKIHDVDELRSREAEIGSSKIRRIIVEGTLLTSRADA